MASTAASAFNEFKSRLLLTETQKELIKSRQGATKGYVNSAFASPSDLPIDDTKLIGSAQRDTIIRPIDDIDLLAVFQNRNSIFERYRHDSRAFLYRVRDALNAYSSVRVVGARGQAVRFFYTNAPHVDVAPVFRWNNGGYALPNGTGGWLTTDPDQHATWIDQRNSALSYQLKPMSRMIKRWNNVHSKYLKSFHIEVMVANAFSSMNNDSEDACGKFFRWAPNYIDVPDPAGHGGSLSGYLTPARRTAVLINMQNAQQRAAQAASAGQRGNHAEAIRLWRIIFGDEFPAYG
jgi:hypothetical protein